MKISHNYYLIIDLEATCSDDGSVPRNEMEIIEIGAVILNAHTLVIASEFQTFIRPVRHPILTEFCTKLTGITQVDLANAPLYSEAIESLKKWIYVYDDAVFCSWGDYDRHQFLQDCSYHQIAWPFRSGHINLKAAFAKSLGLTKKAGVSSALRHLELTFEGKSHRGLDDARNIARIVQRVRLTMS